MCGHFRRHNNPAVNKILSSIGLDELILTNGDFYPASVVDGIIVQHNSRRQSLTAQWWFLLDKQTGKPNYKYATFNARNLDNRVWSGALRANRCVIPVTGIGESIGVGNNKRSYLLESEQAFFLGGLYNTYEIKGETVVTFAVITRDSHPRFSRYHDKATPLFMPGDVNIIEQWLDPSIQNTQVFNDLLGHPAIPVNFTVTPVQTTRKLIPVGEPESLLAD